MNLFQKYGIKEVADVVFYSITTVGDENFYTPVLFLDTLKVSTLEKSAEKVVAKGGKGNKQLITWNFGKEITLNLEDALFSPASMSMIWGGKLNSKLSDYTSAIVKCNLANKYGDLHYSIKAYPSPALTDDEWEIVFAVADEIKLDSNSGNDNPYVYLKTPENEKYVDENRNSLIQQYFRRSVSAVNTDNQIIELPDYSWTTTGSQTITHTSKNFLRLFNPIFYYNTQDQSTLLKQSWGSKTVNVKKWGDGNVPSDAQPVALIQTIYGDTTGLAKDLLTKGKIQEDGSYVYTANKCLNISGYFGERGTDGWKTWKEITTEKQPHNLGWINLTFRYRIFDDKILPEEKAGAPAVYWTFGHSSQSSSGFNSWQYIESLKSIVDSLSFFYHILGEENMATSQFDNLITTSGKAMPQIVIKNIMEKIDSLDKVGYIDTDIHDIEVIDRMEKCIVKNRDGLSISTAEQKKNLFKYYADDRTSSYTIYYDAKTMLPLFRIVDGKIDTSEDDIFTIKMGTVYYKWTRTVKYKESDDDAILGKTLVIDAETFPDAYKIVGETYIRNQKTGKDQRYQFTIHRANVSTDTSVTLEAEGDPTTFSMQIDVLTPPNDIMMELKQYDVEDDLLEGGTRIVPQKSKYTYTPANTKYIEEIADKNEEIY